MSSKYVLKTKNIENCKDCPCEHNGFCGLREKSGDNNACVKELKPKQLEWIVNNNGDYESTNSSLESATYIISVRYFGEYMNIRYGKTELNHSIKIKQDDAINKAKQACQEHSDKIFYEMIGE